MFINRCLSGLHRYIFIQYTCKKKIKHRTTTLPLATLKKTLQQLVTINFHLGHGDDKNQKIVIKFNLFIKNGRNIFFVKFASYAGYMEIVLQMCSQLLFKLHLHKYQFNHFFSQNIINYEDKWSLLRIHVRLRLLDDIITRHHWNFYIRKL